MELSHKQHQREVILHLWNQGIRITRVIQLQMGIGLSTIYYNLKKLNKTGSVAQKKVKAILAAHIPSHQIPSHPIPPQIPNPKSQIPFKFHCKLLLIPAELSLAGIKLLC